MKKALILLIVFSPLIFLIVLGIGRGYNSNFCTVPYKVSTVEDLYAFDDLSEFKAGFYREVKLVDDLDFSGVEYVTQSLEDMPLNGNGHSIKNISITTYDTFEGLFTKVKYIHDLTIENLTINSYQKGGELSVFNKYTKEYRNVKVSGEINIPYVDYFGCFQGMHDKHTQSHRFDGCDVSLEINGGSVVGGFIGANIEVPASYNTTVFVDCTSNCEINAQKYAGGFMAQINKASSGDYSVTFNNCTNNGDISSQGISGGIVGEIGQRLYSVSIKNCTNNGVVSGSCKVGGIVGIQYAEIVNCTNNGTVYATSPSTDNEARIGGISGLQNRGIIANCVNNANIKSEFNMIGGIVGEANANVVGNVNNGDITGNAIVGGIVGISYAEISIVGCKNYGDIEASAAVGGIIGAVGMDLSPSINNNGQGIFSWLFESIFPHEYYFDIYTCENEGDITADTYAGGIAGIAASKAFKGDISLTNISEGNLNSAYPASRYANIE